MPISAKWKHKSSIHIGFIVFNGGVTTFFAKSVILFPVKGSHENSHTKTHNLVFLYDLRDLMGIISLIMTKHTVQRRLHRFAYLIIQIISCYW